MSNVSWRRRKNQIKRPNSSESKDEDFPTAVQLGDYHLEMDDNGKWILAGATPDSSLAQVQELQARIAALELENSTLSSAAPPSVQNLELQKRVVELERENTKLQHQISALEFRNKVMLAMCTISEADYLALCREAQIQPRDSKHFTRTSV